MQKPAKNKPKKQANFNQNKPKNKQPASLQNKRKSTKKLAQIRGKNARLETLSLTETSVQNLLTARAKSLQHTSKPKKG